MSIFRWGHSAPTWPKLLDKDEMDPFGSDKDDTDPFGNDEDEIPYHRLGKKILSGVVGYTTLRAKNGLPRCCPRTALVSLVGCLTRGVAIMYVP